MNDALGHLFVISAPSGAGKTSLVRAWWQATRLGLRLHTTRPMRAGESTASITISSMPRRSRAWRGRGSWTRDGLRPCLRYRAGGGRGARAAGEDVILEIDWQGAHPRPTISVFILPPSVAELERRLRGRGDRPESVARRMRDAAASCPITMSTITSSSMTTGGRPRGLGAILPRPPRRTVQSLRHADLLRALVAP